MFLAGNPYLKLSRVHSIVAFNKRVPQVVDAKLLEPFQSTIVKIQVVWIPEETLPCDLTSGGAELATHAVHVQVLTPCDALSFPATFPCSPAAPELYEPHTPAGMAWRAESLLACREMLDLRRKGTLLVFTHLLSHVIRLQHSQGWSIVQTDERSLDRQRLIGSHIVCACLCCQILAGDAF